MKKSVLAAAILLTVSGCFSHVVSNPSPMGELIPVNEQNLNAPYRIGVGDKLEVKFFSTPDLNTEVQVRPDGRISMMFADDIRAAGLTPEQLARKLKEKLQKHLKKPDMVVSVKGFGSQRVYIGGEVLHSGAIQLQGRNSLIQVLMEAGWITPLASSEEIIIVRRNEWGRESVYHVNSAKIISGIDTGQDVMILPGDVILVPPLGSVDVDRWIDRNMRQMLPIGASANYNYTNYYDGSPMR